MADTQLNHRIGGTWEAAGQVKASNELTLELLRPQIKAALGTWK